VQPVSEIVALCHAQGVPVVVDAAQSLGHVEAVSQADAVIATSRKWLTGPRGVGILAVRPALAKTLVPRAPAMGPARWPQPGPELLRLESAEAHVAGRVGLAVAVGEFLAHGPVQVFHALAAVGRRTRLALGGLTGWEVVEPLDEACAITTVRPPEGIEVTDVRAALLDRGIVTTVSQIARAPRQLTQAALRISPHVDVTESELETLLEALAAQSVGAAR
jgi:pyridoxal 5-phosphate dependent beta-lyase